MLKALDSAVGRLLSLAVLLLVFAGVILFLMWKDAVEDLKVAKDMLEQQRLITEAADRQTNLESRLRDIVEDATEEIRRTENYEEQIPPDVAAAWSAGIDRVRNNETDASEQSQKLQRPTSEKARS